MEQKLTWLIAKIISSTLGGSDDIFVVNSAVPMGSKEGDAKPQVRDRWAAASAMTWGKEFEPVDLGLKRRSRGCYVKGNKESR